MRAPALVLLTIGVFGVLGTVAVGASSQPFMGSVLQGSTVSQIDSVGLDGRQVNLGGNPGGASDGADGAASLSPGRSTIAFLRSGDLWLMNTDGSGQRQLFAPAPTASLGGASFAAPWSPDGTKLAIRLWDPVHCCEWWLVDTEGSGPRLLFTPPDDQTLVSASWTPSWSPDGSRLALDIGGGSEIVDTNALRVGSAGIDPVWSPDGSEIVSTRGTIVDPNSSPIKIVYCASSVSDAAGRPAAWSPRVAGIDAGDCPFLAWSPHGRWIAVVTSGGRLYLAPRAGGRARKISSAASAPFWSPDGSRLAFLHGEAREALSVARGDGTHAYPLAKHATSLWWSPTGNRLAFDDGHRLYVAMRDARPAHAVANDTNIPAFGAAYWSPNGRWLAYVSGRNRQIAVVGASGGPPRYLTDEPVGALPSILGWTPDSRRVLYTAESGAP
jgi:Tol biopolymer transport system component